MIRRASRPSVGIVLLLTLSTALLAAALPTVRAQALDPRPNVVVILTDDQGLDFLDAMPTVREQLAAKGTSIDNAFIPTSLCCPSRSALLTGRYSHTTGVYFNKGDYGGWPAFHPWEDRTIAVALDDAGYRTALIGKYLNEYSDNVAAGVAGVPPGWDVFSAMSPDGRYYDYSLIGTEPTEPHGSLPEDYSTDVLGAKAVDFIDTTPVDQPFFLYFTPFAPHYPFTPAPRDIGTWHLDPLSPAVNEKNVSDKPAWVRALTTRPEERIAEQIQMQHEALMSVDDAVANIVNALGPTRAANTLFVFASDNGLMNSEHRIDKKYVPYAGATEVPLIFRWDGHLIPGATDSRVMTPEDITQTIVEATAISMNTEGIGLVDGGGRNGTVLEAVADELHPAYCGYRTPRYMFAQYSGNAGTELYDYAQDPYELVNVAGRGSYAKTLDQMRAKAVKHCSPVPPGFVW